MLDKTSKKSNHQAQLSKSRQAKPSNLKSPSSWQSPSQEPSIHQGFKESGDLEELNPRHKQMLIGSG